MKGRVDSENFLIERILIIFYLNNFQRATTMEHYDDEVKDLHCHLKTSAQWREREEVITP